MGREESGVNPGLLNGHRAKARVKAESCKTQLAHMYKWEHLFHLVAAVTGELSPGTVVWKNHI